MENENGSFRSNQFGALHAAKAAQSVNSSMETSMARLASGKRINGAADDSAGMATASRLTSEARGMDMAYRNAADAQSLIDTAESALVEIENILQRINELCIQGASDTHLPRQTVATLSMRSPHCMLKSPTWKKTPNGVDKH